MARTTRDRWQVLDPNPLGRRTEWAQQATGPDGDVRGPLPGAAGGKRQPPGLRGWRGGTGRSQERMGPGGGATEWPPQVPVPAGCRCCQALKPREPAETKGAAGVCMGLQEPGAGPCTSRLCENTPRFRPFLVTLLHICRECYICRLMTCTTSRKISATFSSFATPLPALPPRTQVSLC